LADFVMRDARITLRLPRETVDRLDRMASEAGCSRARAVERLIEGPMPVAPAPTLQRALELLAESAESGSITARVGLAKLLASAQESDPVQRRRDELAQARLRREGGVR
jgi:hypothetical protein